MERGSSPAKLGRTDALTFFSAEEVVRARSYHRPLYWTGIADVTIEAFVLATLVWSGAGATLDPGSLPWWGRTPAYAAIVVAGSAAVRTPLALWSGLIRERRWGFSTQRLPSWVPDRAKAVGVNIGLTAVALLGLVGFARALPGWWAAPAAAAFAFAALLLSFVAPVVLEPLFNRYSPLQDATLAAELRRLAERAGVPIRDVLVQDASRRTRKANAYVSGLGRTRRVVVSEGLAAHAGMDVELKEVDVSPLQIQGPKSRDVVRDLFGDETLELRYYFFTETEVAGIPVVVTRTGWTSEIGYEVYLCDSARGTDLWELIMQAGEPYGIRPTGPSDIRRIEGGIFNWGADMTSETNPFELGLDRLVDLDVDCIARNALRRMKERGVSRRIVGVEIDGDRFPTLNFVKWPITVRGERVGKVTSAVYSPRVERNIGYAWVPVPLSELGTQLEVESEWGRRSATVAPMPFWDPEKQIPVS